MKKLSFKRRHRERAKNPARKGPEKGKKYSI